VLIAAAVILIAVHPTRFGEHPRFALGPAQARAAAAQFARLESFDPSGYRTVVHPITAWEDDNTRLTAKYFVERREIAYAANAFRRNEPLHAWEVRFFKPLQREEMRISVDPSNGRVLEFDHILPEDQPGAALSSDAARDLVLHAPGLPSLQNFVLKETSSEDRKARRDHTLVWEAQAGDPRNLDDAHYRVRITVAGNRIASLDTFWKLPETFERARFQRNALSYLLLVLRIAVSASLLVVGLWLLIDRTRKQALRWKPALWVAVPLAAATVAGMVMNFPLLFTQYPTTFPIESFEITLAVGMLIAALGLFLALACGAALILSLDPDALAVLRASDRKMRALDAVFCAALAAVLVLALARLHWLLIDRFHPDALLSTGARTLFATLSPAVSAIASACQQLLFSLALLALLVFIVQYLRRWPGAAILAGLLAAAAFVPGATHSEGEFFLYYGIQLLDLAAAVLFVKYIARENHLAYLLVAWTLPLLTAIADLLSQPNSALHVEAGVLIGVLLATLVWALVPVFSRARPALSAG